MLGIFSSILVFYLRCNCLGQVWPYGLRNIGMTKKKRKMKVVLPPVVAHDNTTKHWYKKTWPWITGFTVLVGWGFLNGVTALSNAEKLPSAMKRAYEKASNWFHTDQEWTGAWTNEGNVDARDQPSISLALDLLVMDRSVQGTISSGPQRNVIPLEFVLVEGTLVNGTLELVAFDYFNGIPKRIATLQAKRIEYGDQDQVEVQTTWQAQPWFPEKTILWRAGPGKLSPCQNEE